MWWEHRLADAEKRDKWAMLIDLLFGPIVVVLSAMAAVSTLYLSFDGNLVIQSVGFWSLAGHSMAFGGVFGLLLNVFGRWRAMTMGETIDEIMEGSRHRSSNEGSAGLGVLILMIGSTCGTWLFFDGLVRGWIRCRYRKVDRARVSAVLTRLHERPTGVPVREFLASNEHIAAPGKFADVLRYIVVHQWATVARDAAELRPIPHWKGRETWIDAAFGPPVAKQRPPCPQAAAQSWLNESRGDTLNRKDPRARRGRPSDLPAAR